MVRARGRRQRVRLGPGAGLGGPGADRVHLDWRFDPDPAHASEIEVRFHADGPEQTTVEVEHRQFDRLVGGEGVYNAIEHGGGGWVALLAAYAQSVERS